MTDEIVEPTVKKKKRVNSKGKGSGYERHIAALLTEKLAPMKFRRSQSSGAILGGENAKFLEQFSADARALFVGDVVPTNETDVFREQGWKLKFTIECKFYKTPDNLEHLFAGDRIPQWFAQAERDAAKVGKIAILIFKFNHTDMYVAVDRDVIDYIPENTRSLTLSFTTPANEPQKHLVIFRLKEALQDLKWWKEIK